MSDFQTLYQSLPPDSHQRGRQFENICKWFLETDPHYSSRLQKVWLWQDWPGRWGADCGIDLVARDTDGKVWAIQAKCYEASYSVTKHDIDKFLSESTNEKIHYRLLIATTDQMGANSRKVILRQNDVIPVNMVLLNDLEQAPLIWPASVDELDSGHVAEKATPRPHQVEAIEATASGLTARGQMIMACGTGKTLTALWIAEKLASKRTLVLLPSLLLLSKTLADWVAHTNEPFAYLPVCSDETVTRGADAVMSSTSELAFPSTTDAGQIASFLRKSGNRVIFSTYQSSPQIAEAFKQGRVPGFDLVIADEAHRCAGKVNSEYGTVLDEEAIPSKKRLFMTATPRVYTPHLMKAAEDSGIDVASMDDEAVFGPVLHQLTFGQAIEKNLLSDYQVVVVGIDDPTYQQMVADRRLVETETGITSDARSLASHIGLAKAMDKYDLRRVITFHSRVNWASQFATELSEVIGWMPKKYRPSGQLTSGYVSGDMSTSLRNQRLASLAHLEEGQRAVLANARCLSEGVDVPALDGVAFIDPRKSEIDIVQAVGRAIRLSPDKVKGTIIIPVFISDDDDPDVVLSSSEFDKVWKVVNALRAHDEALGEELDGLRTQLGKRGSTERPSKIVFDIPIRIGQQFATAFDTRLVEATTASWYFWFGLLQGVVSQYRTARVPQLYKTEDDFALGTWITNQRVRRDRLSSEQVAKLESLPGWTWDLADSRWEDGFNYLVNFVTRTGSSKVPASFKTDDGFALGNWLVTQRVRKDTLSPERVSRLEALPNWHWDVFDERWEFGFDCLKVYVKREGSARVNGNFVTEDGFALGKWVSKQRSKGDKLSPEREARLESIPGWVWEERDARWEEGYTFLSAFAEQQGHTRVPAKYKTEEGYALGRWVNKQRIRKNSLPPDKIARLESLNCWVWNVLDVQWEQAFDTLKEFAVERGGANVSQRFKTADGFALGVWVNAQRNNKAILSSGQVAKLESLPGWVWDEREVGWERAYKDLLEFTEQHGNARVPQSFKTANGFALGSWVARHRLERKNLSPERIARLESILGWVWNTLDAQWDDGYSALKEFVREFGHAKVSKSVKTSVGYPLAGWVSAQRQKKDSLSPDRVIKLESLPGWVWDIADAQWKTAYSCLEIFVEGQGHASPPTSYRTKDGFGLGAWVTAQRYKKSKLSSDRVKRLESLPGWVWNTLDAQWEEGFSKLRVFVQEESHAKVPAAFKTLDGFALGSWVNRQRTRKNKLSPKRITRLEVLPGWVWDAR